VAVRLWFLWFPLRSNLKSDFFRLRKHASKANKSSRQASSLQLGAKKEGWLQR
jgi:hypothetical protein